MQSYTYKHFAANMVATIGKPRMDRTTGNIFLLQPRHLCLQLLILPLILLPIRRRHLRWHLAHICEGTNYDVTWRIKR